MIQTLARVAQRRGDVLGLEVGHLLEYLLRRETRSQEVDDIDDADSHSADAGPTTALFGIDRDAVEKISHGKLSVVSSISS